MRQPQPSTSRVVFQPSAQRPGVTVSVARMQELDAAAIGTFGIPRLLLMEHAGLAVAQATFAVKRFGAAASPAIAPTPSISTTPIILVCCGPGYNGGDGLAAARHLDNAGIPVRIILLADPGRVRGAAAVNLRIVRKLGIPVSVIRSARDWSRRDWTRKRFGLIIDALLGTGIHDTVREPVHSAVLWINRQRCPVLSVDLPSGLSSDTGRPCGVAVRASRTITLGLPKTGLRRASARAWSGRVEVADISLPRILLKGKTS